MDISDTQGLQTSEATAQLNHMYNKANGDLENDLDTIRATKQHVPAMQRQSSVAGRPVNGLKAHEQNVILQRMAIVEVKKPGKGSLCCRYDNLLSDILVLA